MTTKSFRRESELREFVARYLVAGSFGLQDEEVQFYEYSIDQYGYSSSRDETVAVELKMDKWPRALEQAIVYQLCADKVLVAMPSSSAVRADMDEFERYGVGLVAVLPEGKCEELVAPRFSPVVRDRYKSELVGRLREQP